MLETRPKSVTVHKGDKLFEIIWRDDHISKFPLHGLRKACPCVVCKGGHAEMGKPVDPSVFFEKPERLINIQHIDQIGNYAIQITWSDGHNSGIYKWETLREMCPCEQCKPEFYT